jgi:hypothetical protein
MHVRPLFRSLVPALLSEGLVLAVVTFSPQADLIKDLLRLCFPAHVRLGDNTFVCGAHLGSPSAGDEALALQDQPMTLGTPAPAQCAPNWLSPTRDGKRSHLQVVCDQYSSVFGGYRLAPHEILLIDDDRRNIAAARAAKTRAIWFQADEGAVVCEKLLLWELLERKWDGDN